MQLSTNNKYRIGLDEVQWQVHRERERKPARLDGSNSKGSSSSESCAPNKRNVEDHDLLTARR